MGAEFRLIDVSVRYRDETALSHIDLHVGDGERVAFVGPSGSGKTTLLRLLNGAVRPSSGRVQVDGRELTSLTGRELRRIRSRIGFVPQDLCLVPTLRVSQNVLSGRLGRLSFAGALRALLHPRNKDLATAHALLNRVGIPEKLFERTDRLSGGQQQRVAIARTLMQEPAALLADEPIASVDPARARDTVSLLSTLAVEEGLTLGMSLHHLQLAREFFPRLIGLRRGEIAFDRPSDEIEDAAFEELYRLEPAEILSDGA